MSGLSLQQSTYRIEKRSVSKTILSNETLEQNCTTIECFDRSPHVISSPWFIGLIAAVIVLIIIIAIVCGIMKRKGGKYSVQDKEMLHGPSGYGDDEGKFTEYYRAPGDVSIRHSRISLNNGDDRDSMEEFNDEKDRGRFTEDGSFIGQYGRDDKRRTYLVKYDESMGLTNETQTNNQGKSTSPV